MFEDAIKVLQEKIGGIESVTNMYAMEGGLNLPEVQKNYGRIPELQKAIEVLEKEGKQ
jgi:hypothetical protein